MRNLGSDIAGDAGGSGPTVPNRCRRLVKIMGSIIVVALSANLGVAATFVAATGPGRLSPASDFTSSSWSLQKEFPVPAGDFKSVSCSSPLTCVAIGTTSPSAAGISLYQTSNGGTTWADDTAILPAGSNGIDTVSCASPTFCELMGSDAGDGWGRLAFEFNGNTVEPQSSAALFAGIGTISVSCVSPTFCEAVGAWNNGLSTSSRIAEFNGSRWVSQRTPPETGGIGSVTCVSSAFCEAVGEDDALNFNGSSWTNQTLPAGVIGLTDVSCVSANFCEAVGEDSASELGVALGFNGRTWAVQALPLLRGQINGLSCASPTFCEAVGGSVSTGQSASTGAIYFDGRTWASQEVPVAAGNGYLNGVSCVSSSFCEAVGQINEVEGSVLNFNGSSWVIQALPPEVGGLNDISCVSGSFCDAVGEDSASGLGVALGFNGRAWAVQSLPIGVGGLNDVSCISSSFCEAVGSATAAGQEGSQSSPQNGIALGFDGTDWTSQPLPSGTSVLNAVSCASRAFCEAVGGDTSYSGGFVLDYNGRVWTGEALPPGTGSLNDVSCTSRTFCEAMVPFDGGASYLEFNGTSWVRQEGPADVIFGNDVACVAPASCEVVGGDASAVEMGSMASGFNGRTWTSQSLPSQAPMEVGGLNAVACTSLAFCEAVGMNRSNTLVLILTFTRRLAVSSRLAAPGTRRLALSRPGDNRHVMPSALTLVLPAGVVVVIALFLGGYFFVRKRRLRARGATFATSAEDNSGGG